MKLHNRVNNKELKAKLRENQESRITLSFYQYASISEPKEFRDNLFVVLDHLGVMGRVYVASEGVNGQISVPKRNFEIFKSTLYLIPFLNGIRLNFAIEDDGKSFFKLKIKVREKIVADGLDDSTFDPTNRGIALKAKELNQLMDDPTTIVVDMRNHYESEVGFFKNAIKPDVVTFREALPYVEEMLKDKKDHSIVMYCTGGIRCEKASAYYKHKGFRNVFMVEGGIIEYARQASAQGLENKFLGKNFVFDERMGERISEQVVSKCHQCGKPCDSHVNCANDACHILFLQCEECRAKYQGCCSAKCTEFIQLPADVQKELRKTTEFNGTKFSKGRYKSFRKEDELVLS